MITPNRKKKSVLRKAWNDFCARQEGSLYVIFFKARIMPWLRQVRFPNLFTVIGDPLAGACVASALKGEPLPFWMTLDICFCSLLLYIYGVIQNDWCDLPEDSRLRPERPLPSRQISVLSAALVAIACFLVALILALLTGRRTFIVAIVLGIMISAYNFVMKKSLIPGSVSMGLCRGLSMLLGASVVGISLPLLIPVAAETFYIGCVTWLSEGENRRQIPKRNVYLPCCAFGVGWLATLLFLPSSAVWSAFWPSLLCILAAIGVSWQAAYQICDKSVKPEDMRVFIGKLITCLIPWQAALIMLSAQGHVFLVLVCACIALLAASLMRKAISQS